MGIHKSKSTSAHVTGTRVTAISLETGYEHITSATALDPDITTSFITAGTVELTLPDGKNGAIKIVKMIGGGGAATLTPAHYGDATTLVFDSTDSAILQFFAGNWWLIGEKTAA